MPVFKYSPQRDDNTDNRQTVSQWFYEDDKNMLIFNENDGEIVGCWW